MTRAARPRAFVEPSTRAGAVVGQTHTSAYVPLAGTAPSLAVGSTVPPFNPMMRCCAQDGLMRHQQLCSYGMFAVSACSCMVSDMSEPVGRRERKKAETRSALASAAMRLALEHGVENVTAEAIAEAADVAPRTFHNYFSSKEEAIVSEMSESLARLADRVRAGPAGEPVWDALQNAMVAAVSGSPKELAELAAKIRMINANPSLLAARLALFDQVGRVLAPTIAARTGTDVEHDLYPRLVAIAAMVAMNTALDMWLKSQCRASPIELTTDAFTQLRAGLPEPHLST